MEAFEDYGQGLSVDVGGRMGSNQERMFHIHPHYELLLCSYPVRSDLILCGQQMSADYPLAVLVSPFIPHYASAVQSDAWRWERTVLYFGDEAFGRCGLPFGLRDLLGGGAACVFDMRRYFGGMRLCEKQIELAGDAEGRIQVMGMILNTLWRNRERRNAVMNRPNDYILEVIDYITAHPQEKLTAAILAGRFYVSRDKLKKDFKRSTYMNLGDFVQQMRMNLAKELLWKKVPVNEVIQQCGYESSSYFFKRFREETGKTPLQFGKH